MEVPDDAKYEAHEPGTVALPKDRVRVDTPPDPKTGRTHAEMEALEFVRRINEVDRAVIVPLPEA